MRLEIDIPEHHYNNIMALDSVSLGRVPYKGIIMYSINAIKHGKVLEQEPTTENDLEVQKAIEIIKADSLASYSVNDILSARDLAVEALKQMTTTKNDLGVDCIDRAEVLKAIDTWDKFGCDANTKLVQYQDHYIPYIHYDDVIKCVKSMPSVTPQLSVSEVTALAEWTTKLTKECEEAYNKGYADGMKAQEPRKGHWDKDGACPFCGYFQQWKDDAFCGHCGAQLGEVEE